MAIVSRYRYKYDFLTNAGFLPFEAREVARQYTVAQFRNLKYLVNLVRWRRLYVRNLQSKGLSNKEIIQKIKELYIKRGWVDDIGRPSPWDLLRSFRKQVTDSGGTASPGLPPTKRSHHGVKGLSKGDIEGQRKREHAKRKTNTALRQQVVNIEGRPIYNDKGMYLGKTVVFEGRSYTVRADGSIM